MNTCRWYQAISLTTVYEVQDRNVVPVLQLTASVISIPVSTYSNISFWNSKATQNENRYNTLYNPNIGRITTMSMEMIDCFSSSKTSVMCFLKCKTRRYFIKTLKKHGKKHRKSTLCFAKSICVLAIHEKWFRLALMIKKTCKLDPLDIIMTISLNFMRKVPTRIFRMVRLTTALSYLDDSTSYPHTSIR